MRGTCDSCSDAKATYIDGGSELCGDCACWDSAVRHGERYAAVQTLAFAVEMMRRARFTRSEILAACEETLTTGAPPESQVATEGREDRWLRGAVPLSALDDDRRAA